MSNLSYCRYENTLKDLQDCQRALQSDEYDVNELSASEFNAMVRLIDLCGEIYHEFEPFPTCVPEEDDGNIVMEYIYNSEDKNE